MQVLNESKELQCVAGGAGLSNFFSGPAHNAGVEGARIWTAVGFGVISAGAFLYGAVTSYNQAQTRRR